MYQLLKPKQLEEPSLSSLSYEEAGKHPAHKGEKTHVHPDCVK